MDSEIVSEIAAGKASPWPSPSEPTRPPSAQASQRGTSRSSRPCAYTRSRSPPVNGPARNGRRRRALRDRGHRGAGGAPDLLAEVGLVPASARQMGLAVMPDQRR